MSCASPKATKKTVNWGKGPMSFCPGCKGYQPAAQVPWGSEKRNARGEIVATFACLPH